MNDIIVHHQKQPASVSYLLISSKKLKLFEWSGISVYQWVNEVANILQSE